MERTNDQSYKLIRLILKRIGKLDQFHKVISSYRTIIAYDKILSLDLIGLSISEVYSNLFEDLTNLSQLYLSWNNILELPDGIFDNFLSLRHLDLRGSGLTKLNHGIFDNLTSLQRLELNDNKLTILPEGIFNRLTSLRELNLSNNKLETLTENIFDPLINLEYLYLYFNPLPGDISFGNYYDREAVVELIQMLKSRKI